MSFEPVFTVNWYWVQVLVRNSGPPPKMVDEEAHYRRRNHFCKKFGEVHATIGRRPRPQNEMVTS